MKDAEIKIEFYVGGQRFVVVEDIKYRYVGGERFIVVEDKKYKKKEENKEENNEIVECFDMECDFCPLDDYDIACTLEDREECIYDFVHKHIKGKL